MTTPHKWAEVIKAWADGKTIQFRNTSANYVNWSDTPDITNSNIAPWNPHLGDHIEWRVKPEKKTGWIAISIDGITSGIVCESQDEAKGKLKERTAQYVNIVACIQIEYTEGEGL